METPDPLQKPVTEEKSKSRLSQWISDFFDFKIMIFPYIVKALYILTLLAIYCAILFNGSYSVARGFFAILIWAWLPIAFIVHIFFEFVLLAFSILDTLREIRNELKQK